MEERAEKRQDREQQERREPSANRWQSSWQGAKGQQPSDCNEIARWRRGELGMEDWVKGRKRSGSCPFLVWKLSTLGQPRKGLTMSSRVSKL
jgi:hypothetical protein